MASPEVASNDPPEGTDRDYQMSWLLNDFLLCPTLSSSMCSEINMNSSTLEMLEAQMARNNQDKFIDISYT